MKLGCVVLAAGKSRRFGGNKLLAQLGDRPVLAHVLDSLPRERFARLSAVVSDGQVEQVCAGRGIACLRCPGGPQSESVRRGVRAMAGMDGCLFVLGDQPLCTRASLERLTDAFLARPQAVVRLAWNGRAGSPVMFPGRYFSALERLTGDRGGMAALRGLEPELLLVQAGAEEELWDADTPEALEALARRLRART